MNIPQISGWIMLMACGIWAGGIVIFAVERTYQWRIMSTEQYAIDFRRSVRRVDPLMPILGAVGGIAALIFALHRQGPASEFAWVTIGLILLVIVMSIVIAEPINSKFRRLPEGQVPTGVEDLRIKWRRFHLIRTIIAVATFASASAASLA